MVTSPIPQTTAQRTIYLEPCIGRSTIASHSAGSDLLALLTSQNSPACAPRTRCWFRFRVDLDPNLTKASRLSNTRRSGTPQVARICQLPVRAAVSVHPRLTKASRPWSHTQTYSAPHSNTICQVPKSKQACRCGICRDAT